MTLDKNTANKAPGDPVRSADWNDLAAAVLRHETDKLDISGGTVTGSLTVQGGLTAPQSLGVQLLKPDNGQVNFDNIGIAWRGMATMISQQIQFQTDTTLLLIGHGHGTTPSVSEALTMRIVVDGVATNSEGANDWGSGYLAVQEGTWVPVTAIGTVQVPAGSHTVQLTATCSNTVSASLRAPTLWVIRLGARVPS
ncbi:hypothetical protein ACIPX0_17385 [Streptomyces sp. NPDC090075]|uniref:hypothetical protein n=1 Tax=unclassified Streptomyces TaxID=2593676 RepID=UPI003808BEA3